MALALVAGTLSGCKTTDRRLHDAAVTQGQVRAIIALPDLPDACREAMGIVQPKEGEKWRAVQLRWEIIRSHQNERLAACAAFYDDIRARYAQSPTTQD